jgi:hypothetical protein
MKRTKAPTTITELREDLLQLYAGIGVDVDVIVAKEKSNAAGKILKSVAIQLKLAELRKETPEIPFVK